MNHAARLLFRLRNRHFLMLDLLVFLLSTTGALALRTDGSSIVFYQSSLLVTTFVFLIIKLVIYVSLGLYQQYWRYASIDELARFGLAALLTALFQGGVFFLILRPLGVVDPSFPRSIPFLDMMLAIPITGAFRYSVRYVERFQRRSYSPHSARQRVLIMGAGDAGIMLLRELQRNPSLNLLPVGFVDDDVNKHHVRIYGVPVLGGRDALPSLLIEHQIQRVIIAMPTAPGTVIREVVMTCEKMGVGTKIVPGIYELVDGTVKVNQLRDIQLEDLLRRDPIQTNVSAIKELIAGRRVLITGGGGSIGGELCRQVLHCGPRELVLLGHGENSVFEIHNELQRLNKTGTKITAVIADIRFADRICAVFDQYRPEIVFHAAAHKHVPLMESNPAEAITNNVLGTRNVLRAALAVNVQRFVMISTDKAVNPTSIMGASKRAAELLVHQAAQRSGKPYVAVRFGNVLGSRGSVVLTFKKQIAAGGR
jgi:FlaA1/EpsC-like NDP-sugar epimerase